MHVITSQQTNKQNLFLKSQSLFSSCVSSQSSLDQHLLPHYLTGPPSTAELPHWTTVRCCTQVICYLVLKIFWALLYFDIFTVWVCRYFEIRTNMGLILVGMILFIYFFCFGSCYFGFPTSLFEFFHSFHSLMHIWKFKLIDIG